MNKESLLNDISNYRYVEPNLELLKNTYQNDYIKFRHPFYNSEPREPENWYIIEMTKKIIEYANKWKNILIENNCPSDFQIWLFQPYFNDSQIVATRIDDQNERRDNFFRKPKDEREFPYEYFGIQSDNIDWDHRNDTRIVFDFENPTSKEIDELIQHGYTINKEYMEYQKREVTFYEKVIGNVWVGRFK